MNSIVVKANLMLDTFLSTLQEAWNVVHHACAGGNVEVLKWLFENVPEVKTAEFLKARTKVGFGETYTAAHII